jgi:flagellar biosynthesis/type III secretory pathway chaperone
MMAAEMATRSATAGEHVQLMRALGCELERAMDAIAGNRLEALEDSIASQQSLSRKLGELAKQLAAPVTNGAVEQLDHDLQRQIRDAVTRLEQLNQRYSILLQQSSRSAAQMAQLFSSVHEHIQEDPGTRSRQTLSCQV